MNTKAQAQPKFTFNKNANPFLELLRWSEWAKEDDKKTAQEWGYDIDIDDELSEELKYLVLTDGRN